MALLERTDIERRALTLVELIYEHIGDAQFRKDLLKNEPPEIAARVNRIITSASAMSGLPTELPNIVSQDPPAMPTRFKVFKFVEQIGYGGMGEVWRAARDDGLYEQDVAIKLIQSHLQLMAGEAFESERRILARLEHPNIARLIDGGKTADGRACLVMEFVDGVPFDAACAPLPLKQRLALFIQAAEAVDYAHRRLIAHGDLKPNNLLVDSDCRVRLLDFGIARFVSDDRDIALLNGAMTSSCASPQRQAGEPPSIADDVYALGCLLQLIVSADCNSELSAIAAKATRADAEARYHNVSDLIADIERFNSGYPVNALRASKYYIVQKFVWRNWRAIIGGCAVSAALIYASAAYFQAEHERSEASARYDDARGAAHYLLFTLYDQLEARPNTLLLRREVARVAQHYLARLANSRSKLPAVKIEAAQGLLRLAEVEGGATNANLGQPNLARPNIDAAVRLLSGLDTVIARRTLAQAWLDSAYLAEMIEDRQAEAVNDLDHAHALIATDPFPPPIQRSEYYIIRSTVAQWQQRYRDAIIAAQQAETVLPRDAQLQTLVLRSKARELHADALYYDHHQRQGMLLYQEAVAPLEKAVLLYPNNMFGHRRLGHALWAWGSGMPDFGDPKIGVLVLRRSIAEMTKVADFDALDEDAKRSLEVSNQALATALLATGDELGGFAALRQAIAVRKAAWQLHPTEPRRLRDYTIGIEAMGDELLMHHHASAACPFWRQSLSLFNEIARAGHLSKQDQTNDILPMTANVRAHCP